MIYTFGDSFTKYYWPTWSDWLQEYSNQPVINLGHPGFANELFYYKILEISDNIQPSDQVYIMWTGSNRVCEWYDNNFVNEKDWAGFFPDTQGSLWFTENKKYQGFYKSHPDSLPSLTDMIIRNFDIILKTQLLLDSIGCEYHMMFWQNPWLDTREIFLPTYSTTWNQKERITKNEIELAQAILEIKPLRSILKLIKWNKFVNPPNSLDDPSTYNGIYEFVIDNKELVLYSGLNDKHPNSLAQHDWTVKYLLKDCYLQIFTLV